MELILHSIKWVIEMDYQRAIKIFKEKVKSIYGDRLVDIILYGSAARGGQNQESDIDLLVLLDDYENYWDEVHRIGDIEFEINGSFDFKILISAIPVLVKDFKNKRTPLFLNIKREGMSI